MGHMLKSILIFYHAGPRDRPFGDKLLLATEEPCQPCFLVIVCLVLLIPMFNVHMFPLHTGPLSLCVSLVSWSEASHGVCLMRGMKDGDAARTAQSPSFLLSLSTIPVSVVTHWFCCQVDKAT